MFMQKYYNITILIILHMIIWVAMPLIFHQNISLDMSETVTWGHEWQLGYYKHPPLSSWLVEIITILFNNHIIGYYLLSQLSIAITFIFVFLLAGYYFSKPYDFLAVLLLEGIIYYHFLSPEFNPNILQLPLWAAIVYFLYKALHHQPSYWRYWLLTALCAALSLYTKYYSAMLLISVLCMIICHKPYRQFLTTWKPYIAALLFLILMTPHLYWLWQSGFITFDYIAQRSYQDYHWSQHIMSPLKFFGAQLTAIFFSLIIFLICFHKKMQRATIPIFLVYCGIMPLLLTMGYALITAANLKSMWGVPLFNMLGIILLLYVRQTDTYIPYTKMVISIAMIMAVGVISYSAIYQFGFHKRADFNGKLLAQTIDNYWQEYYGKDKTLTYAITSLWLGGNINFYHSDRPHIFIDGDIKKSPWIDIDMIKNTSALVLWYVHEQHRDNIPFSLENYKNMQINNIKFYRIPYYDNKKDRSGKKYAMIALGIWEKDNKI